MVTINSYSPPWIDPNHIFKEPLRILCSIKLQFDSHTKQYNTLLITPHEGFSGTIYKELISNNKIIVSVIKN